jgi:hypothetical protein
VSDSSLARLKRAERAADSARAHLGETLSEIQDKLSPANILNEATRAIREKRSEVRDQVMSGLLSRPMVATALLSAAGWAFRKKPALAALLNLFLRGGATTRPPTHSTGSRSQRPRRRRAGAPAAAPEENA